MSLITVDHLTFYYDGSYENIFEDVSFQLDTDWKLGFIGRNGKGKTTFLNILQGKFEYRGNISGTVPFEYFPFEVSDEEKDTIEIIEEADPTYELWKICRELNLMDMDADRLFHPFCTLSNGERTKVMLAVLFSKESAFLLIDEPTNHLDMEARQKVAQYLKKKKGFILVSHDRTFLDECIDHVLVLNRQSIEVRQGNFSDWWQDKQSRDAFEKAENEKLKREIGRLEVSASRTKNWGDTIEDRKIGRVPFGPEYGGREYLGEKSRKMQQRRKNMERRQQRAIDEKKDLLKDVENEETLKIIPLSHHKEVLVQMKNCSLSYEQKTVREHFDMELKRGERVVLAGKNGCGKSSVLKTVLKKAGILDEGILIEGEMNLAAGLKISYVPQDASFLRGSLHDFAIENGIDETLFLAILRKLDFERSHFEKDMGYYSAGQKKKVLLARSICEQAHLYIWDEPLNYIDVFSRMQIENLLKEYGFTMLIVEHDACFVKNTATRVIGMDQEE